MNKIYLFLAFAFMMTSCKPEGSTVGPCVHIYEEPILTIESVTSAGTGVEISSVSIFEVMIDSISVTPAELTHEISENVTLKDSAIVCYVPCAFGTQAGFYQFSVSAQGHQESSLNTTAEYKTSEGGCPSRSDDGEKISFTLQAEQ